MEKYIPCGVRVGKSILITFLATVGIMPLSVYAQKSTSHEENPSDTKTLDEVIVTAQKKSEQIQNVPIPITVINTEFLNQTNKVKLEDIFTDIPSLSLNVQGNGQTSLAIRGITTGGLTSPTVGITIDGIPFGASSLLSYGSRTFPDLDPVNLSQIEVLRGPQGTLYGASSLGGLIKFETKNPDVSGFFGHVEVDGSAVNKGGRGYGIRAAVNIPISNTFAARASAFKRQDPGYVDDPSRGRLNVNRSDIRGGHFSALWSPVDAFTLKLGALSQETTANGTSEVEANYLLQPTIGDLNQNRVRGSGNYKIKNELYSAIATIEMRDMILTSASGYGISMYQGSIDNSITRGPAAETYFGVSGATLDNNFRTYKFSQELRLSSSNNQFLEWLIGGFYTKEDTRADQWIMAIDPPTGMPAGILAHFPFPTTYKEYAAFANLTLHFTEQFDVQFGARRSYITQTYSETDTGPLVGGVFVNPSSRIKGNAFTYLITPRFKISPNLMMYARVASGYRAGGPNADASMYGLPLAYEPDKTVNYEIGIKADLFDRALSFDASVYHIDWKGVQLQQLDSATGIKFFTNGGSAKSEGVEMSLSSQPANGLQVVGSVTFGDAKLSDDLPPASGIGFSGDRLPYSSSWSGSLSLDKNFPLADGIAAFVGARASYVGGRYGNFPSALGVNRSYMPAYASFDVHAGLDLRGTWSVTLFAKNFANKRGILSGEPQAGTPSAPYYVNYIQPRTIGISVTSYF